MDNVDIKDFWLASGVSDNDYVVLSLNAGTSARISVSTLRDAIGAAIKPTIVDGEWHIGGVATGVEAGGETPVFRWTEQGIEYKYETDGDDSWQLLVPSDEIVLDFDSLTAEQRDSLRLKFSDLTDAEIAELQQPANEMIAELERTNESVQSAENARVNEFEDLKNASEAATNNANEIANHPTYIGEDNYVYRWDNDANVYVKTNVYVKGEQGETPSFETGSVTTLEPNQSATGTVVYVRTESDGTPVYKINLSVPRGQKGENGSGSGNVLVETTNIVANKKYIFQSVKNNDAEGVLVEYESQGENNVQSDWNVTDETSDAYIKNKPSIPSEVTESTVSGWGFTKNTGNYSKPSNGIPKSDLDSSVQNSLGKADTALQSYTEQYKGTVTGVKMNGTTKNPSNGVVDLGDVLTEEPEIAIVEHGTSDTTFTLTPNVMHKWGTVASLNLSLGSSDSGVMTHYMATFTSGSTATTFTVPESVVWNSEVSIEANKTYELSIVDNRGIIVGF